METHMNLFLYDNLMIWACVGLTLSLSISIPLHFSFSQSLTLYVCVRLSANLLLVAP